MTLIPVSRDSDPRRWLTSGGESRWIGQVSQPSSGGPPSRGSPSTLNSRPSASAPTGTRIGRPVLRTVIPRARPSVGAIAMARTVCGSR